MDDITGHNESTSAIESARSVQSVVDGNDLSDTTLPAPDSFHLQWRERLVIVALMIISFFTSFEAIAIGPPLPVYASTNIIVLNQVH
jgi:hypothetical protein